MAGAWKTSGSTSRISLARGPGFCRDCVRGRVLELRPAHGLTGQPPIAILTSCAASVATASLRPPPIAGGGEIVGADPAASFVRKPRRRRTGFFADQFAPSGGAPNG